MAARGLLLVMGLMLCGPLAIQSSSAESLKEYELKAAFIYNFTKFIEWPPESLPITNTSFVVGVAGFSPTTVELKKIAHDRKIGGRDLVVIDVKTPAALGNVQILLIPAAEDSRLKGWLASVRGRPVLTIGESEAFAQQGGMINFLRAEEKIRFEIYMDQVDAASLKVSAQLQKLARIVRRK